VKQVAAALQVSTATIYALVRRHDLDHVRVLNAIRIPAPALSALTRNGES